MNTKQFKFYSDAGHGWIAVPKKLLNELGISNQISGFSYESKGGKIAYLEEDADASLFAKTYKEKFGKLPDVEEIYHGNNSPIRCFPPYHSGK